MYILREEIMNTKKVFFLFTAMITLGLACSLLSGCSPNNNSPENQGENDADPTPSVTRAIITNTSPPEETATLITPTNTPLPEGEESITEELPPQTFEEILQTGIENGNWTEGEGLVQMMKYFVGQISGDDISGISEVGEESGTGIVRLAGDYLNSPDGDPEMKAELERLFRILSPPQEILDSLSKPRTASPSFNLISSRSIPAQLNQEACMEFAGTGYEGSIDLGVTCYLHIEQEIDGNTFRVYYPEWWQGDEEKESLVGHSMDALAEAAIVYGGFQALTIKDVNLVFAILASGGTNGEQYYFDTANQACPLTMYPRAAASYSLDIYKQIVAHELFHCVQDWSFPNTSPYGSHKWWLEGTAHYFSNLVYPNANREWRSLSWFDANSANNPIFFMTYENFVFFQFMGNKYSPEVLIDILMRVSAGGGPAGQSAALANVQGMDANFNRFVVEYLSNGVLDSGGGRITTSPSARTGQKTIADKGEVKFTIQPFVAMRYFVDYKQEKRFLQNAMNEDDTKFSGVEYRLHQDINSWSDLPPEIRSECEKDVRYLFAITTTEDSYTNYDVNVTLADKAECDPCLLGSWDVDPESYEAFMERIMAQAVAGQTMDLKVGGHQYLQFLTDGKILSQRDDFAITVNDQLTTTLNGNGSGNYTADGEDMTVSNFIDTTESVALDLGGVITYTEDSTSFSIFGMDFSDPTGGISLNEGNTPQTRTVEYVCENDTMTITMPDLGELLFNRVDRILPTPIPTPAPPDNPQP